MKRFIGDVQIFCGTEEKEIETNECPYCGKTKRLNDLTCDRAECWARELNIRESNDKE
jgi:hypothetical protein